MAAQRVSGKALAAKAGMSQNYLAKRLRDEAPFTLDDVETLVEQIDIDIDVAKFFAAAIERNSEAVQLAMHSLQKSAPREVARREALARARNELMHGKPSNRINVVVDADPADLVVPSKSRQRPQGSR